MATDVVVVLVGGVGMGWGGGGGGADRCVTTHEMHLIVEAVSLWTRPPALHLCAGPQKLTPSAHRSMGWSTSRRHSNCDV